METQTGLPPSYEDQVVSYLFFLKKAMDRYLIWGQRAIVSDVLWSDPQFEPMLRELIQAMRLCGQHFLALPKPPQGGWDADQVIRCAGQEILLFVENVETMLLIADPLERRTLVADLALNLKEIKQNCRQFAELYERAFPGQLSSALHNMRAALLNGVPSAL